MTATTYEADAHCAVQMQDGRIVFVRRGDTFPGDVEAKVAEAFVANGLATRFERI